MFTNEKELVDTLVEYLRKKYKIQYITRELQSGNNIADVVYSDKLDREYILFDNYINSYYYVKKIYNKHKIGLNNLEIENKKNNKEFKQFLRELEKQGYIKVQNNKIEVVKKVDLATKNLVAIEAKLFDWKAGIEQATRYKEYSNKVYVAIEENEIKKINKNIFKEKNIGLMSVSKEGVKEIIKPKKEKIERLDVKYYMTDKFLQKLCLNT